MLLLIYLLVCRHKGSEFKFQVIYSSSESEVEMDKGVNTAEIVEDGKFADDVILPLSKLELDEDCDGKIISSSKFQIEGQSSQYESCHDPQTLIHSDIMASSFTWRSSLSKIEVWYASFGSNMWKPRFLCYIEGGKVSVNFCTANNYWYSRYETSLFIF